jgi:hypothetical protein
VRCRGSVHCAALPVDPPWIDPVLVADGGVWGRDATQTSARAPSHGCERGGVHVPGIPKPGREGLGASRDGRASQPRAAAPGDSERGFASAFLTVCLSLAEYPPITMPRTIQYSEKYQDDIYEYRFDNIDHPLPQRFLRSAPCAMRHPRAVHRGCWSC